MTAPLTASQKIAIARHKIRRKAPYFTSMALTIVPVPSSEVPTLAMTEHGIMLYNADFVQKLPQPHVDSAVVHEMFHFLKKHCRRARMLGIVNEAGMADERLARLWNIAGDCENNEDAEQMGFMPIPGYWHTPKSHDFPPNKLAEEYFSMLREQESKSGGGGGGAGAGGGNEKGGVQSAPGDAGPHVCDGWCGSAAGRPVPGEPDADDPRGRTPAEIDRARRETAEAIKAHIEAHGRGSVPAGLSRWAEVEITPPKIPWRTKLDHGLRRALAFCDGSSVYRHDRVSRRQSGIGFGPGRPVLPALRRPMVDVLFIVDTSGSMGKGEVSGGVSEAVGLLRQSNVRLTFGTCDAGMSEIRAVSRWQDLADLVTGGGGTDFTPIFEAAKKLPRHPSIVIVYTDGDGSAPEYAPPEFETIWVLCSYKRKPAQWGTIIEIDDV